MATRNNPVAGEVWTHFRGTEYLIVAVGEHTEENVDCVVYQSLNDNKVWIRPLSMFMADATTGVPRFLRND